MRHANSSLRRRHAQSAARFDFVADIGVKCELSTLWKTFWRTQATAASGSLAASARCWLFGIKFRPRTGRRGRADIRGRTFLVHSQPWTLAHSDGGSQLANKPDATGDN